MAIEIVDFPIKNSGSFHSYVSHYQRVSQAKIITKWIPSPRSRPFLRFASVGLQPSAADRRLPFNATGRTQAGDGHGGEWG